MPLTLGMVYDRVRWEEKLLLERARTQGLRVEAVDAKNLRLKARVYNGELGINFGDVVLQRCISHYRGLHVTAYLEAVGLPVVNPLRVATACGNKFLTSLLLAKAGVPIPKTILTFTPDEAVKAVKELEYPAVFKPVTGSWGRMIAPLRDEETTRALIEFREQFPGPFSQIYYLQEMVKRPPRDIRTIVVGDELVAAVYRHAPPDEWRTNVARGGITAPCPITQELQEIALKAADAVGGGVLGVDAMESPDGIVVHEVNGTIEFKGAASATGVDIPGAIIDYTVKLAKR